jgi:hypothetical protein
MLAANSLARRQISVNEQAEAAKRLKSGENLCLPGTAASFVTNKCMRFAKQVSLVATLTRRSLPDTASIDYRPANATQN